LYDLLVRNANYNEVLKPIPAEKYGGEGASSLYLIGSNVETRHIANSISDAWAVVDKLEPLRTMFDYCLIDTAPTPSLLHGAIYLATDFILYPTLCEFWSFDGLAESMSHRRAVEGTKPVTIAGIIPMRVRVGTLEHMTNLRSLQSRFGDLVWPMVPERIVWAEAATYQVPVFLQDPHSDAAAHAWEIVDRVEALAHGK
jgi:chromosome partitioning protein